MWPKLQQKTNLISLETNLSQPSRANWNGLVKQIPVCPFITGRLSVDLEEYSFKWKLMQTWAFHIPLYSVISLDRNQFDAAFALNKL